MRQTTKERFNKVFGDKKIEVFKWIIVIFHLVGIVGLSIPVLRPYFQLLTPFHLLLSTGLLLVFHKSWNTQFLVFMVAAFFIGFFSEVIGVHTGLLFGQYKYGTVLGIRVFEVPLMIGINWFLLVYLCGEIFENRIKQDFLASVLGAGLMVLMDFLIEPVAIALNFWSWENNVVPISNYLGWFFIAFIIQMIYRKLTFEKSNPLAPFLLVNLLLFFAILNFVL
jgi:uncharacterized membrane protein